MKRRLYLVRHAEAADKAVSPERELTEQGVRDAKALADVLKPLRIKVRGVWHSGKARALQTAEGIEPALRGGKLLRRPGLKPFDSVKRAVAAIDDEADDLMIVGHEPFLGKLAARLVTGRSSTPMLALGKPSVACLEHDGSGKDGWRVAWVIGPEQLADRKGKQRGSS